MKQIILGITIVFLIVSCDNRQEREVALNTLETSLKAITDLKEQIIVVERELVKERGELEVASDRINRVKEFYFLRTGEEREEQIRAATENKIGVEENIKILSQNIVFFKDSLARTEARIKKLKEFLKE